MRDDRQRRAAMHDEQIMIDGYNVIFRAPDLRDRARVDLEQARAELARRIAEAFRGRRERITIVFDGNRDVIARRPPASGPVRVVFSSPPDTADQKIQRLVEEARRSAGGAQRLELRIVTSDREVAGRARLWGARAVAAEDFLREVEALRRPAASSRHPRVGEEQGSRSEIEEWERLFRERGGGAGPDRDEP